MIPLKIYALGTGSMAEDGQGWAQTRTYPCIEALCVATLCVEALRAKAPRVGTLRVGTLRVETLRVETPRVEAFWGRAPSTAHNGEDV